MTAIAEARRIDGQPARLTGSPIDSILNRVQGQLRMNREELISAAGMHHASISRCRKGKQPLREAWILRLHLLSAIPVSELFEIACVEHEICPHIRARRPS